MESLVPLNLLFGILVPLMVLAYWTFVFFTLYHLTRFGIGTKPKISAAIYLAGSIALFFICYALASGINIDMVKVWLQQAKLISVATF